MENNKNKEDVFREDAKQMQAEENQRLKDHERIPNDQNRMKPTENQFR